MTSSCDDKSDVFASGVISRDGFKGIDRRSIHEIVESDAAEIRLAGINCKAIAGRMEELRDAGIKGLGNWVRVEPGIDVMVESARGGVPCPFGDSDVFQKNNTTVVDLETRRQVTYSDLSIHLILEHGFFEGRGSLYRIEPKDLVSVLGLKK